MAAGTETWHSCSPELRSLGTYGSPCAASPLCAVVESHYELVNDHVGESLRSGLAVRAQVGHGPVLKAREGQEGAMLCNGEEGAPSEAGTDVLLEADYDEPDSPRSDTYDKCDGVHDMGVQSHPVHQPSPPCGGASDEEDYEDGYEDGIGDEGAGPAAMGAGEPDSDGYDAFSEVGAGNTEVVYVREGVCVRPTEHERISGRLSLIRQDAVLFLSWLPYSHGELNEDGTFRLPPDSADRSARQIARDRGRYAVHPLPLSEVKAIKRCTPSFGWQYIAIVLTDGLTLPPLYFSTGGVKALFGALREHALLIKSSDDPHCFLVNDTADPLQRSLASLELADVLLGGPPTGASGTFAPPDAPAGWDFGGDGARGSSLRQVLEQQFQQFRQLARDTTSSILGGLPGGPEPLGGAPLGAAEPTTPRHPAWAAAASCPALGGIPGGGATTTAPCGGGGGDALPSGGGGGGDLLCEERRRSGGEASTNVGVFELIDRAGADLVTESRSRVRPPPLSLDEWGSFLDAEGRIADEKGFRQRVFYSGVEPALRRTAWKFLLGLFPCNSTAKEREALMAGKRDEYRALKAQWATISEGQAARFGKWRERRGRVDKDVRRTDRAHPFFAGERNAHVKALRRVLLTYSMFNFDLGYCQGMSDLAAPILAVMRDEAEAFWCFAALMERMEANFHTDCTGMHAQLLALRKLVRVLDPPLHASLEARDCLNYFFCYRWLLIHFKREVSFEEVLRLWEALWSGHLSAHFHLYCVVALLEHHRRSLMDEALDFDGLLKYCIDLSGHINLDLMLRDAEILCKYAGAAGRECLAGLP